MTIKECKSLIKEMKTIHFLNKGDKTKLIKPIFPVVSKLRFGNAAVRDIKKAVNNDEFDKAVQILRKTNRVSKLWPLTAVKIKIHLGLLWYLAVLFLLVTIFVFFLGYRQKFLAGETASWPQTTGIISESYISETVDDEGTTFYEPVIDYNYTVYGETYTSDHIAYNYNYDDDLLDSIINCYPVDSLVTVYYHPKKHKKSVLEYGYKNNFPIEFFFGFIALLPTIILIIIFIKIRISLRKSYK